MLDDEASRFVPLLRREKKGMTDAGEMNNPAAEAKARELILEHCKRTAELIKELEALAIHHQIANRYAEPFLFTTRVMTSAIEWWRHFIRLRKSPEAEPHMQLLAAAIEEAIDSSRPIKTDVHVPFKPTSLLITDTEFIAPAMLAKAIKGLPVIEQAVAKCARISYLNYDKQFTPQEDAAFVERLWQNEHRSPFEHVCVSRAAFPEMANEPSCMGANWLTLRQVMERYAN
jgi:thymidylate synthase ThyX